MTVTAQTVDGGTLPVPSAEVDAATVAVAPVVPAARRRNRALLVVSRLGYALPALCLFVVALGLMKTGASALAPALGGSLFTDNAVSPLGLGWLGACLVLSGSPVATASLTLLDGGVLDRIQSLAMLTGSRLGASFVVLVVGFLYAIRRRRGEGQKVPLTVGVMSLLMTSLTYLPGAVLAGILLKSGALDGLSLGGTPRLLGVTQVVSDHSVQFLQRFLPDIALFPIGMVVLLVAFKLFDSVLPDPASESEALKVRADAWYHKPWPMFAVGCAVTLLTLSVAVSLTVLIPLVAKGYLDHEDALPYAAGANITTLADTLLAAILLGNAAGIQVVAAILISIIVWTLILIGPLYRWVRPAIVGSTWAILKSRGRLAAFTGTLFLLPLVLVAL